MDAPRPRTKIGGLHDTAEPKPSYRSWKKKYRKMRIVFDQKMAECEKLHKRELEVQAMIKRIAVENDRILDLLHANNECEQIPSSKRINLSLPPSADPKECPELENDSSVDISKTPTRTSFHKLLAEVPHLNYADTLKVDPEFAKTMEPLDGDTFPLSFLTADDIDNYLYELDLRLGFTDKLSTMAPLAQARKPSSTSGPSATSATGGPGTIGGPAGITSNPAARDFALKNPTSVYNWLRKHAPNTFLQDAEAGGGDDGPGEGHHHKARGAKAAKTTAASKRAAAARSDAWDAEGDDAASRATPAKGKRKRERDDDTGYRPKGGSSARPSKKKRKSEGADQSTSAASRKVKKEAAHRDD